MHQVDYARKVAATVARIAPHPKGRYTIEIAKVVQHFSVLTIASRQDRATPSLGL